MEGEIMRSIFDDNIVDPMLRDLAAMIKMHRDRYNLSDGMIIENLLDAYFSYLMLHFLKLNLTKEEVIDRMENEFNMFRSNMNVIRRELK